MVEILKLLVAIINELHDFLTSFFDSFGVTFTDKELHFIIIGIIGMVIYLVVNSVFKALAKYSISLLSFIYTATVLLVIVFGIEIMQKITNRGHMEFADIIAGLWGFTAFFATYLVLYGLFTIIKKGIKKLYAKDIENDID
ncbi:hypothetical protein [Clostridium lacusfryxellense]|uniref:hypothetical protein n=1 Tax=Clostridium lacusfryxellense TaxID=205328 RepID=UPI001C0B3AEC|nr:hypothetical protein [Clostridium lacusfryxellense]MBU3111004.1 hypothetical protein [Clostridium lacusfryxellense]